MLATEPAFRTLYYYRLRRASAVSAVFGSLASLCYPGERTLHIMCSDVGPGLIIQHGFATVIAANRIGANCWVNQQVTIGFKGHRGGSPVLGDNVQVYAGAKILGEVTIGDGAQIGANAVVIDDVPPYHTAVGVPARCLPPRAERTVDSPSDRAHPRAEP
ncbi:MAG: serine acetyltransferase [Actinobacteria bacterium]|nr:serine acetyltransferase [Actinomycetota bacterium]